MIIRDIMAILSGELGQATQMAALARLAALLFVIVFCLSVHEFAHAFAAKKLGDDTAFKFGRMTLNPMKHFDPIGTAMILLLGFGYAKPVPVNPGNFNRLPFKKKRVKKGMAICAAAGPVSNFILAALFWGVSLGARQLFIQMSTMYEANLYALAFYVFCSNVMLFNVWLGLFNLLPIPPLDGSRILDLFLPLRASVWMHNNEHYFRYGLMGLLFLGFLFGMFF